MDETNTQRVVYPNGWTFPYSGQESGDISGAIYGAHIGYNWQFDRLVVGLEASIDHADIDGCGGVCDAGIATRIDLDRYATTVARLGYTEGNLLLYGFGGVAWASVKMGAKDTVPIVDEPGPPLSPRPTSNIHGGDLDPAGWMAGFGIEYALSDRLSVRAEYSHVDLGEESLSLGTRTDVLTTSYYSDKVDLQFDVVKVGASYKLFDGERLLESVK